MKNHVVDKWSSQVEEVREVRGPSGRAGGITLVCRGESGLGLMINIIQKKVLMDGYQLRVLVCSLIDTCKLYRSKSRVYYDKNYF